MCQNLQENDFSHNNAFFHADKFNHVAYPTSDKPSVSTVPSIPWTKLRLIYHCFMQIACSFHRDGLKPYTLCCGTSKGLAMLWVAGGLGNGFLLQNGALWDICMMHGEIWVIGQLSQKLTDEKLTLVQVMASWHYLGQYWSSYMTPYGITRPQWVNQLYTAQHDFQPVYCEFTFPV